jgi:hypothetical protein
MVLFKFELVTVFSTLCPWAGAIINVSLQRLRDPQTIAVVRRAIRDSGSGLGAAHHKVLPRCQLQRIAVLRQPKKDLQQHVLALTVQSTHFESTQHLQPKYC